MKYIELSTSKKARICRALGVSRVTLWSALTFQTQSQLAEKIRRMAVQNGGRVMIKLDVTEGFMPNCEIDFVHVSAAYNGSFKPSRTVFEWSSTTRRAQPASVGIIVP